MNIRFPIDRHAAPAWHNVFFRHAIIVLIGLAVATNLRAAGTARGTGAQQLRLVAILEDGSRIVGTTPLTELPVTSSTLGKLRIPLAELDRFEQDSGKEEATVVLNNGDRILAFVDLPRLELDTLAGRITVPVEIVLRIEVQAKAESFSRGLVGYWSFDDGKATDHSGHAHHGRLCGDPKSVAGVRGRAFRFDREGEWIKVEHSPELDLRDNFTLCAWIQYSSIDAGSGSQIVWYGDTQPAHDPYQIRLLPDGRYEFAIDPDDGSRAVTAIAPEPLKANTWYFLAATFETTPQKQRVMKAYVNGQLACTQETSGTIQYDTSRMWLAIGAVDNGTWQNYHGLIDEVRIYNRPLPESEIRGLYSLCAKE